MPQGSDNTTIKYAILKTFAYRAVFSYPLSFYQTYSYLISDNPIDFARFKETFIALLEERKLSHKNNLFHLGNIDTTERLRKEKESKELMIIATKVCRYLRFIPWIKLICVTGAVAAGNAHKADDVDILVITGKERLWVTRFLTVSVLKVLNLYRKDSNEKGKICPNIFIDEAHMVWNHAQNIYTAHEVLLMKPIFDRGHTYFKFLEANLWVRGFLPHLIFDVENLEDQKRGEGLNFLITIEYFLMKFQLWYMQKKKTKEITTERLIHFKRDDHSDYILNAFKTKCVEIGLTE